MGSIAAAPRLKAPTCTPNSLPAPLSCMHNPDCHAWGNPTVPASERAPSLADASRGGEGTGRGGGGGPKAQTCSLLPPGHPNEAKRLFFFSAQTPFPTLHGGKGLGYHSDTPPTEGTQGSTPPPPVPSPSMFSPAAAAPTPGAGRGRAAPPVPPPPASAPAPRYLLRRGASPSSRRRGGRRGAAGRAVLTLPSPVCPPAPGALRRAAR